MGCWKAKWIQWPGAIAPDDLVPRLKILHKTPKGVKLNRTMVVVDELANENEILNKLRGNQNIIKMQGRRHNRSTSGSDR